MTEKERLIASICNDMGRFIDEDENEFLKIVLERNLKGWDVSPKMNYLSVDLHDNLWILQRYTVDLVGLGRSKNTIKNYVWTVNKLLINLNVHYSKVTGQMCMDYIAAEGYKRQWSQTYKSNIYRVFSAFWGWAYKKHYIDYDVKQDLDRITAVPKKKDCLTIEEVERCRFAARALGDKYLALLELMLTTGCRVGELVALTIENINFQTNEISIWGEKTQTWRLGYLSPAAKIALLKYLDGRDSGPIFINSRGQGMCDRTAEIMAKKIGEMAECHIKTTVHVYRKTFASIIYTKTADILLVSKMLGHATTATTIKCYLVDDRQDQKNRMNKAFI